MNTTSGSEKIVEGYVQRALQVGVTKANERIAEAQYVQLLDADSTIWVPQTPCEGGIVHKATLRNPDKMS